jgi:hypothetical protein
MAVSPTAYDVREYAWIDVHGVDPEVKPRLHAGRLVSEGLSQIVSELVDEVSHRRC